MRWFFSLCLILLVCTGVHANQAEFIVLDADEIIFAEESQGITANGGVKLDFGKYITSSNAFVYKRDPDLFSFPSNFHIIRGDQNIYGTSFHYNMETYQGEATDMYAKINRLNVRGERMVFDRDKVTIHNATFTTCDHNAGGTHYKVSAKKMFVYPLWGFFVAVNAKVEMGFLPFPVPVPAYIYGAKRYGLSAASTLIPDVGVNDSEGFFVKQRVGYFVNKKSQGAVLLGSTETYGGYLGVEHGLGIKDNQELFVRGIVSQRDKEKGKIRYTYNLTQIKEEDDGDILAAILKNFSQNQPLLLSRFHLEVAHRELINDERVNFSPLATLEFNDAPLGYKDLKANADINFGKIGEEEEDGDLFQAWESNFDGNIYRGFKLSEKWTLRSDLFYSGYWYDTGGTWQRFYTTFAFKWDVPVLNPEFSYSKRLMPNVGESPFLFEQKYAIVSDEVGLKLVEQVGKVFFETQIDYSLEQEELRNLNIELGYEFTCWRLSLKWRVKQNAFGMGFSL